MIRNVALYAALRVAQALLPWLPLPFAYRVADLTGRCAYWLLPGSRRSILANLSIVTGRHPTSPHVRALAREAFSVDARNWIDTLRIPRTSDHDLLAALDFDGWDRIEEALAPGRGLVIAVLHLGNMDLVGQAVVARGFKLTVPVEHMQPAGLFRLLLRERRSRGLNAVPVEQAPRALLSALRRGEIVAIAADRGAAGRTLEVQFFGRPAFLPRGAVSLARRTGASLLVGVALRLPSGGYRGMVSHPIDIERSDDPERDDRENTQRLAGLAEEYIDRFPGQWLAFSPVWQENSDNDAATIRRTKEAAV